MERLLRYLLSRSISRVLVNQIYNRFGSQIQGKIHSRFRNLFTDFSKIPLEGTWQITVSGRPLTVPLRRGTLGLDWDFALSILGHDAEVKNLYSALIRTATEDGCFVDVGASYGTHSVFFSAVGWHTICVEPNPECAQYLCEFLSCNEMVADVELIALSDENGDGTLSYPDGETWLGSLGQTFDHSISVKLETLDHLVDRKGVSPTIIKVDTEGHELSVLRGAEHTLRTHQPLLIFESLGSADRDEIWKFAHNLEYEISSLHNVPLTKKSFLVSNEQNFLMSKA